MSHGYTLKEIADHLRIHYTSVSKVIAKTGESKK
jgi:DNA-binding MarR family transcriptional regulator